jgi:hypothetical protein
MKADEYGNDLFKMQLWDKDLIDSNDLIGETEKFKYPEDD